MFLPSPPFISYFFVRRVNLELLQEKGPMAWRHYNEQLDAFLKYLMWIAAEERQLLDQLNRQRRDEQSQFQSRIRQLEDNYRETTERIVHLRNTCHTLEQEIRNWQP
jgi:chromosome segregation ATPase